MARADAMLRSEQTPPLRPVRLGPADVVVERKSDGSILMRSPHALMPYPPSVTTWLDHWATKAPECVFRA